MADDEFATVLEEAPAPKAEEVTPVADAPPAVADTGETIESLTKQVNDLKSQRGGQVSAQKRQDEILSALQTTGTEIGSLRRTVATLMDNYTKSGDPADLADAVNTIQTEAANELTAKRFDASYLKASDLLKKSLAGTGLDPAGAELADVRTLWRDAKESKDSTGLYEAVAIANTVAMQSLKTKPAQGTPPTAPDLEMAIPANSRGGEVPDQELYNRYGRGELNRTKAVMDAAKRLGLPI